MKYDAHRLVNVIFKELGDLVDFIESSGVKLSKEDKEALAEYAEQTGALATLQGRRHW